MFNETNVPGPEYRVRPVVRYVVTRYCHPYETESAQGRIEVPGGSEVIGEFQNEGRASEVAEAMTKAELRFEAKAVLDSK